MNVYVVALLCGVCISGTTRAAWLDTSIKAEGLKEYTGQAVMSFQMYRPNGGLSKIQPGVAAMGFRVRPLSQVDTKLEVISCQALDSISSALLTLNGAPYATYINGHRWGLRVQLRGTGINQWDTHAQWYCNVRYTIVSNTEPRLEARYGEGWTRNDGATPVTLIVASSIGTTPGVQNADISVVGTPGGTTRPASVAGTLGPLKNASIRVLQEAANLNVRYTDAVTISGSKAAEIVRITGSGRTEVTWTSDKRAATELVLETTGGVPWPQGTGTLLTGGDTVSVRLSDAAQGAYGERTESVTISWSIL